MKNFILYLIFIMLLVSCERYSEVDLELPFKDKLVAVSFVEEGSNTFQLALTRTTPVQSSMYLQEPNYMTDAAVTLKTPDRSYLLNYNTETKFYETTMPAESFEEGKTYQVSIEQGGETIYGSTAIPGSVTPSVSLVLDSVLESGTYTYLANISCGIKAPGTHYIAFNAFMVYSDSSIVAMLPLNQVAKPVYVLKNGEQATKMFQSAFSSEFVPPVRIEVSVMVCDKAYALYNNTLNGIDLNSSGISFGEPSILDGNMSNRIGVIGSYRYLPSYGVPLK